MGCSCRLIAQCFTLDIAVSCLRVGITIMEHSLRFHLFLYSVSVRSSLDSTDSHKYYYYFHCQEFSSEPFKTQLIAEEVTYLGVLKETHRSSSYHFLLIDDYTYFLPNQDNWDIFLRSDVHWKQDLLWKYDFKCWWHLLLRYKALVLLSIFCTVVGSSNSFKVT